MSAEKPPSQTVGAPQRPQKLKPLDVARHVMSADLQECLDAHPDDAALLLFVHIASQLNEINAAQKAQA